MSHETPRSSGLPPPTCLPMTPKLAIVFMTRFPRHTSSVSSLGEYGGDWLPSSSRRSTSGSFPGPAAGATVTAG